MKEEGGGSLAFKLFLSWLIPGAGFLVSDRQQRGFLIFVVINLTVLVGLQFQAAVVLPVWTPGSLGSVVINSLTFVMQLGYGLFSLLCLLNGHLYQWNILQADMGNAYFELGTFYLMVAGGLNYLLVLNL